MHKHGVKQLTVMNSADQVFGSQIATSAGQILTPRLIFALEQTKAFLFSESLHEGSIPQA